MYVNTFRDYSKLFGEWSVWHSNTPSFIGPNRMIVGIYPESLIEVSQKYCIGPCILEKTKVGTYSLYDDDMKKDQCNIRLDFHQKNVHLLSIFGIGLDNLPIFFREKWDYSEDMSLYVVEQGDLFLTFHSQSYLYCYHLIRNVRTIEPSVNVPFSTLVATHIVGVGITKCLETLHSFLLQHH